MNQPDLQNYSHTCDCGAYPWLHHAGLGKCEIEDIHRYACVECGRQNYEITTVDFGIGPYEYWGQKCVDRDLRKVTSCCHCTYEIDPETGTQHQIED